MIPVIPGATYTIVVGVGGSTLQGGTDSQILDTAENVLVQAGGGTNGTSGTDATAGCVNGVDGTSGANGLGGTGINVVSRNGTSSGPPTGSIALPPRVGVAGPPGISTIGVGVLTPGGPGYVLLTW